MKPCIEHIQCSNCSETNCLGSCFCGHCGDYLSGRGLAKQTNAAKRLSLWAALMMTFALVTMLALPHASLLAGNLLFYFGAYGGAVRLCSLACSLNSQSPVAQYDLAVALQETGRIDDAIYHYRRAITLSRSDPEFFNGLGLALEQHGDSRGALEAFTEALRLQPG